MKNKAIHKARKRKKSTPNLQPKIKGKSKQKRKRSLKTGEKKSLVPDKYKPHLQKAFVISVNSFVYKKPDFDAQKLYPLQVGKNILISKKVFRPPHNFGSFYKVFLFRETKVVGYISEAEVAPEFIKFKGKYKINPAYKLAKEQLEKDKVLNLDLLENVNQAPQTETESSEKKDNSKNYIGLSAGVLKDNNYDLNPKDTYFGLKLSGYNLLISYLNMDLNLLTSSDLSSFYLDILIAHPLLKVHPCYLLLMGGGKISANTNIRGPVDLGLWPCRSTVFSPLHSAKHSCSGQMPRWITA